MRAPSVGRVLVFAVCAVSAVSAVCACRPEAHAPSPSGTGDPTDAPTETGTASPAPDPFAPQPDESEGLVNVSADLDALLEHGELFGACDRYAADPSDRREELLCGKYMFFFEGFGTLGIPAVLFDMLPELFVDELGPAYSNFGLVPHPSSPEGRPIGFGYGAPLVSADGDVFDTLAFTCAACHFGPLPDGRYAVGAPNHGYDYGRHMLAILIGPQAASPLFDEGAHHPDAVRAVRPMLDHLAADPGLAIQLGLALLPLASVGATTPTPSYEQEGEYASWLPGTMDFLIAPLPIDDGVHTVSKILPLWGLPTEDEIARAGMPNAMLAWTGSADALATFLDGFVAIGGGAEWSPQALAPLVAYIESLRPPDVPADAVDPALADAGAQVYADAGCLDCHGAPRGGGDRVYTFDEIGTDRALMAWGDPDLDGTLCCGLDDGATTLTHGVKSPRLVGMLAQSRFLHNGSLPSLEALLCVDPRPAALPEPWNDEGHTYGCDLPDADRAALLAYLRAH